MTTFITVPADAIDSFLTSRKFTVSVAKAKGFGTKGEKVYRRVSKDNPNLAIVVYSSVSDGEAGSRRVGTDAIRVALVGKVGGENGTEWGLHKTKRIHRTGTVEGVTERILDRVMDCAKFAADTFAAPCPKCGSPTYKDSGRCVYTPCRNQSVSRNANP